MLAAKCKLPEAEKIRRILLKKFVYDSTRLTLKEDNYIYFPILKKVRGITCVEKKLQKHWRDTDIHSILEGKIPKKLLELVPRALDIIGDIAIIELHEELKDYYNLVGNAVMLANKQVKVVCRKAGFFEGEYRTRKLEIIAGEKRKETTYTESGVRIKLNVETCYFSPRLSSERIRIARLVRPKESVLVMFSGVGPYTLVIAKHAKPKEIYAIEINPEAHKYALENLQKNHFKNIHIYKGDVNKVLPKLKKKFDRIIMPLPMDAAEFLPLALSYSKKGAIIHLYDFENEKDISELPKKKVKEKVKKCRILRIVKCGQYSPGKYRICIDIKLL